MTWPVGVRAPYSCLSLLGGDTVEAQPSAHTPPPSLSGPCSLVHGIRACSPAAAYVLCLDDDVALHPGSLAEMVAGMERERDVWMTTGGWRRVWTWGAECEVQGGCTQEWAWSGSDTCG